MSEPRLKMADPNATESPPSALANLRDEIAFFITEHGPLLQSVLCGAALGWVVYSACAHFETPLQNWSILLGIAIIILSTVELWAATLVACIIWTVQMLQFQPDLGWIVGGLSVAYLLLCAFGHGRAAAVLITPHLGGWGIAVAAPIGFGLTLDKRTGWIWSALAFLWYAIHAFLFGSWRLGVPPNPFLKEIALWSSQSPKGFTPEWLRYMVQNVNLEPYQNQAYLFIAQGRHWTALLLQLILWIVIAFALGRLYKRKRESDKVALAYLARASSMKHPSEPVYKTLYGAVAVVVLALIFIYIVLAQVVIDVKYDLPDIVGDLFAGLVILTPLYILFEGHADRGKRAKGRRIAQKAGLVQKRPSGQVVAGQTQGRATGAIGTSRISTAELKREVKGAPKLPRRDLDRPISRRSTPATGSRTSAGQPPAETRTGGWSSGEKIDNQYNVLKEHMGGMGVVYEVVDDFSGKKYAVKSLRDDLLENVEAIERFGIEAKTWIHLDHHENIVQAMMFRIVEGRPLLFLEYIDGTDLERLQKQHGAFSVAQVINWAKQISLGLAYAHLKDVGGGRIGVIHRDLKPANIMLTRQGTIKITDFGLAKVADASTHLTRQATGLGTLAYMPPEQLEDARSVDKRADIYAFGAVLYELLTGGPPATGESVANLTMSILTKMAQAPSHKNPAVPQPLDEIILRCLQKDRQNRFSSFEEISVLLEQVPITPEMQMVEGRRVTTQSWTPRPSSGATRRSVRATPTSVTHRSAAGATGSSGSVTTSIEGIVFIDMAGSTEMGSRYGDDFVLQMKELLGNVVNIEANREKVLFSKGTGDGFMLTFPEAHHAAQAAIGVMRRVQEHNSGIPPTRRLRLRMGIHFGQVSIDSQGDRQGTAVNFASRIEGASAEQFHQTRLGIQKDELESANRLLISEVVNAELKGKPEFRTRLVGYFDFKGISGRHKVFEMQWK